jgi:glutamine---fructose-6-phosphate transaminase (isomerizing)
VSELILAADVGGTHARLAIIDCGSCGDTPRIERFESCYVAQFSSLEEVCESFLDKEPQIRPHSGVIAIAGVERENHIESLSLNWRINLSKVRETLRMPGLCFINDFVAAALGTQLITHDHIIPISVHNAETSESAEKPMLVLGPGTGFGAAALIPFNEQLIAVGSEAGQIAFAPGKIAEIELLETLQGSKEILTIGDILSGPGLSRIDWFLRARGNSAVVPRSATEIIQAAINARDPDAQNALQKFCELLGSAAGDLALVYNARGGVYLAGGILPRIKSQLLTSQFMERFVAKGSLRDFLKSIPVYLVNHPHLGVLGAARWFASRLHDIQPVSKETYLAAETAEAPEIVARQLERNRPALQQIGARLREQPPKIVVTCARGSSDHAATYVRYLIETYTGVLTSSVSPSVHSLYAQQSKHCPDLRDVVFLAISQSGASPDIIAALTAAKASGAWTLAFTNTLSSPLAAAADVVVPLHAGEENSVAASKSYLSSLSALLQWVACWTRRDELLRALVQLPEQLSTAWHLDWSAVLPVLKKATNMYVVGRGLGLGSAHEAALKLKETCGIHAEAYSAAELRHGPLALVKRKFPLLLLSQNDATRGTIEELARDLYTREAQLLLAGVAAPGGITLPVLENIHAASAPLTTIQSFYKMVNALALIRGMNPDCPPLISKVTETY